MRMSFTVAPCPYPSDFMRLSRSGASVLLAIRGIPLPILSAGKRHRSAKGYSSASARLRSSSE